MYSFVTVCLGIIFLSVIVIYALSPAPKKDNFRLGENEWVLEKGLKGLNLSTLRLPESRPIFNPKSFKIYNYLRKSIRIKNQETQIAVVSPGRIMTIPDNIVATHFTSGNIFKISIFDEYDTTWNERTLMNYILDVPEGETIKALHVGMITGKWVGADEDYNIGKNGGVAVQGMPFVHFHNFTDYILRINENINISPNGVLKYTGRDHFGVRLGTVLKDQDEIFPNFIITTPITDLYIGVVSDLQQAKFGGFQLTPEFESDGKEPEFLLEKGWMGGGRDMSTIKYGYIPYEGPDVPALDRWGEPIKERNYAKPIERDPQFWDEEL